MTVEAVTDADFQAAVESASTPVIVDFWAPWCGPCKALAPVLEQFAEENSEKIRVVKIDVDQNPVTAQKFGVRGLPTLMIFKDGAVAAAKSGAASGPALKAWVSETL